MNATDLAGAGVAEIGTVRELAKSDTDVLRIHDGATTRAVVTVERRAR